MYDLGLLRYPAVPLYAAGYGSAPNMLPPPPCLIGLRAGVSEQMNNAEYVEVEPGAKDRPPH